MKVFGAFLKDKCVPIAASLLTPGIFALVFLLYGVGMEPFLYGLALYEAVWLIGWCIGFVRYRRKHWQRLQLAAVLQNEGGPLPPAEDLTEADYHAILQALSQRVQELSTASLREEQEMRDYYTLWIHQIKTPIAALRMLLQAEAVPNAPTMEAELFHIEQYANMALQYIRLENDANDLCIKECPLDPLIRACIRKYAPLFIAKKLKLRYEPVDVTVLTDEKWLALIIEQLLSNAIKYTAKGTVALSVEGNKVLTIRDTGMGIAPEDLPRIFEKGFTGRNGRVDRKATGLGLYLCSLAAHQLNIRMEAESELGKGTSVRLYLDKPPIGIE